MENDFLTPESPADQTEPAIAFEQSPEIADVLCRLNISLMATTYQARRLMTLSPREGRLRLHLRVFERPTGLAVKGSKVALYAKNQVWILQNASVAGNPASGMENYDFLLAPRYSFVTGDIAGHELDWIGDELMVVNTRFSCLCSLSLDYSFKPLWRPAFISDIASEDRCHLNGFATDKKGIRYFTAVAATDTNSGWREHKKSGGILFRYPDSEVVTAGLSMPHSPRLYRGKLWVLDSGKGELCVIDEKTGNRTIVERFPGFLRGLCFYDRYAFIGLSMIRETRTFGDLEVEDKFSKLECAIYCLDTITGKTIGAVKFTKHIEELFDIKILEGVQNPFIFGFKDESVDTFFVLPA